MIDINVESQAVIDEAIERLNKHAEFLEANLLGNIGKQVTDIFLGLKAEREALQAFVGGLTVEVTIPAIVIAVKAKE